MLPPQEGKPAEAPALPESERNRLSQARISRELPKSYWNANLQPGETKVAGGVIWKSLDYRRTPTGQPRNPPPRLYITAVPDSFQPSIDPKLLDENTNDRRALSDQRQGWNDVYQTSVVQYWGQSFPEDQRTRLKNLYSSTAAQCSKVLDSLPSSPPPKNTGSAPSGKIVDTPSPSPTRANLESVQKALVDLATTFLFQEWKLFAADEQAQRRRYGRVIGASVSEQQRPQVAEAFRYFLTGEYLAKDQQQFADDLITKVPTLQPGIMYKKQSLTTTGDVLAGPMRGPFRVVADDRFAMMRRHYMEYEYDGVPEISAVEGRIYVAEHVAVDLPVLDPWNHTSIIAGIWTIEKQHVALREYTIDADSQDPFGKPPQRTIVREEKQTITRARLISWDVGNGCASTYTDKDVLTLVAGGVKRIDGNDLFGTIEKVRRWIMGCTPAPSGNCYRVRAAAYARGNYGYDWVCHQNANAFAFKKWGIIPVNYFTNIIFSPVGHSGISNRDCYDCSILPGAHGIQKGGVPGNNLHFNVFPWLGHSLLSFDPVLGVAQVAFFEKLADGHGHGLDRFWASDKQKWWISDATYSERQVTHPMDDDQIEVQNGWV